MTTVEYTIAAGADDGGFTDDLAWTTTAARVYIGNQGGVAEHGFLRWTGVTIPAGATITAAYISVLQAGKDGTAAVVTVYFDDNATPTAPTTVAELLAKTKTTANVGWTLGTANVFKNSPELKTIIQELVNSYSYAAGAAMQALLIAAGSGNNDSEIYNYENGNSLNDPILHIEYTAAAGIVIPVLESQYRKRRS